jgi:hypothetical protein
MPAGRAPASNGKSGGRRVAAAGPDNVLYEDSTTSTSRRPKLIRMRTGPQQSSMPATQQTPSPPARSHLLIAGTGRTGTSFLVRYLSELGLDTTLSRRGSGKGGWDEDANAGLEELPVPMASAKLPYVIKSPWAHEMADDMLASPALQLDAAILPMRDLVEAAASRTVLELRAMHEQAPWMADLSRSWETWCRTPGGTVYSLSPVDQARLLAVGFHRLVDRLAAADVPMLFLSFPRFIEDADYLYRRLRSVLPCTVTREVALRAHAAVADAGKVRIGAELAGAGKTAVHAMQGPSLADLDRIALARELARQRKQGPRGRRSRSRWKRHVSDWSDRLRLRLRGLQLWGAGLLRHTALARPPDAARLADHESRR